MAQVIGNECTTKWILHTEHAYHREVRDAGERDDIGKEIREGFLIDGHWILSRFHAAVRDRVKYF